MIESIFGIPVELVGGPDDGATIRVNPCKAWYGSIYITQERSGNVLRESCYRMMRGLEKAEFVATRERIDA